MNGTALDRRTSVDHNGSIEVTIMTISISVAEAKARLSEFLRQVEVGGERVVIERRGRPIAVLQKYVPEAEQERPDAWVDRVYGVLRDDPDFGRVMDEVVRSRRKFPPRPFSLDDD
jgi:prevent-host-death family protein